MKTIIYSLFILFVSAQDIISQDSKIKFGKVSPADLAMKEYKPDPEASAVILSQVGWVRYDISQDEYPMTETRHVVLKILDEKGIDRYGNAVLPYYAHFDFSKIGNVKALVHLPDGSQVKVEDSQIFDEVTNDYWSAKKIAFPRLVPGAIIEYQYNIISKAVFEPVDWFFQAEIPIVYAELKTQIPEWFEYVILAQGSPVDSKEKEIVNQSNYDVNFVNYTFINKDVPALREECCITTMLDYYSRIRFRLNSIKPRYGNMDIITNTWKKVAKELYEDQQWGGQVLNKRPGELVLEAAGIPVGLTSNQSETARKIYDFVNHSVQWNGWNSIGRSKSIAEILKAKSGDSGSLNKLIWAAFTQAGISVKPVLVSLRSRGKAIELYPFMDQFNQMILLATIDGKEVWVDAGHKHLPLGTLHPNSMNSRGLVVDKENPVWIDIKPTESKSTYLIKGKLDASGNITGTLESRFTGYHAFDYRNSLKSGEKFTENLLVSGKNQVRLDNLEWINQSDISLPFQMKASVNHFAGQATPDKIYLTHILPEGLDENPFKMEERTYPIEMNYPSEETMMISLDLPEGYAVESIPSPIRYVTENNGIQVVYEATETPGKLNITMKHIVKQLFFEPTEYGALKNLYDQRKQKFNEQIVLVKK